MRRIAVLIGLMVAASSCFAAEGGGVMGYWPFEGNLQDASGAGRHAKADGLRFAEGRQGQAAAFEGNAFEIASAPELQLTPGFTIDCWVYFEKRPEGYHQIVMKDKEYQLRVDHTSEGGRFSFFVYLKAWEPRVSGPPPEPGRWQHLVAQWTGTQATLMVDGQKTASPRSGVPVPTDNPVRVGAMTGRLDELRLLNPGLAQRERLEAASRKIADADRLKQTAFGTSGGWRGWQADLGATMSLEGAALRAALPTSAALLLNASLDVDVTERKYLSLDVESTTAQEAAVTFVTDKGRGVVPVTIWGHGRTSIIDLATLPMWNGRLRVLALSFPGGGANDLVVRNLWISDQPEGAPYLYVRNLAPGRAILRVGREEKIIALVRNLGCAAQAVEARLTVPKTVRVLDEALRTQAKLDYDGLTRFEWTVQAEQPVAGTAELALAGQGFAPVKSALPLRFEAPCSLPQAAYVPAPVPAPTKYLTLMHYCPLWKVGTHYGWGKIEPWPERRPAIGWYDEGTPEVADWHIKYALEHGIQGFIYCWYRTDFSPEIHQQLGHAIHDGMMKARYRDRFHWCIMWENGCGQGVQSREDLLNNLLPYWIKTYFQEPSYLKVDGKPVLFVWQPQLVGPQVGGHEAARGVLDEMRAACRKAGFEGLTVIGCAGSADEGLLRLMAEEGWDASSAYGIGGPVKAEPGRDVEGVSTTPYVPWLDGMKTAWLGKRRIGLLPDIVDVMQGWDPRPWHEKDTSSYVAGPTAEAFRAACVEAKKIVDATPGNGLDKRMVVFDNWCEFGEGHYLEPTSGPGFSFVDAIRDVFCGKTGPHADIIPEDVGLQPPEHWYLKQKEIMNAAGERKVVDDLVAWWAFEEDDDSFARDSSACGFGGMKNGFRSTPGVKGKGFLCQGGSVSLGPHAFFFPRTGITVELWLKTDTPNQSDRWMLNTIGASDTGYRLGLTDGKIAWQVPLTEWSHLVACPEPAPLGRWVHVAATYDNRVMRIYVDGEEKASLPRDATIIPSTGTICLGNYTPGNTQAAFDGVLDEVKVWDRALTAEEVRQHAKP